MLLLSMSLSMKSCAMANGHAHGRNGNSSKHASSMQLLVGLWQHIDVTLNREL